MMSDAQTTFHMRSRPMYFHAAALLVGASLLVGCGGGVMSANDMKQYAMKRAPDVEVEPVAARSLSAPNDARDAGPLAAAAKNPAAERSTSPPPSASPPNAPRSDGPVDAPPKAAPGPESGVQSLPDGQSLPATPLGPQAAARRTAANLKRIGAAFEAHLQDKGLYPARAIFDAQGRPLLSWRVALLPYLGYEELYSRFQLDEPWNSRRNSELLGQIPAVYQSPERFDDQTNYVVPVASSTIFGKKRGVPVGNIEDGATNTVLLLEADDAVAVPWTEPRDYELNLNSPTNGLGSLRGGSAYVVWGGGDVGRVPMSAPRDALRAMFTADGGEDFVAGRIDRPLFEESLTSQTSTKRPTDAGAASPLAGGARDAAMQHADAASGSLSARYMQQSAEKLAAGQERDAMQLFYTAALLAPPGGDWTERYAWVPALRRPTPLVRFGVGLSYTGPRENAVQQAALAGRGKTRTLQRHSAAGGAAPWSLVTGELGEQLIATLASHWEQNNGDSLGQSPQNQPGFDASDQPGGRPRSPQRSTIFNSSHGAPLAPGVYFLAAGRESVLLELARREAVDILLVVEWRDLGQKWSAGLKLVDVVRQQTLLNLPRLSSGELEQARVNPLADNPLADCLEQLNHYLDEHVALRPLPERIEPRHVARRIDALATRTEEYPLPALAEMRFYRESDLADDAQLLLAYQELIGHKAGSELMLGETAAKERLLKAWLPVPLPTTRGLGHATRDGD